MTRRDQQLALPIVTTKQAGGGGVPRMSGTPRITRYTGDPTSDVQPDVGDVMAACSKRTGMVTGTRYRVVDTKPVRGREDQMHRLKLSLLRDDQAEPGPGERMFVFEWGRA